MSFVISDLLDKEDELNFPCILGKKVQSGCRGFLAMLVPESPSLKPQVKHLDLESCDTYDRVLLDNLSSLPARFCGSHSKFFDFSWPAMTAQLSNGVMWIPWGGRHLKIKCHHGKLCKIYSFCIFSLACFSLDIATKPFYLLAVNILSLCVWLASFPQWHGIESIRGNTKKAEVGSNAVVLLLTYGDIHVQTLMNAIHALSPPTFFPSSESTELCVAVFLASGILPLINSNVTWPCSGMSMGVYSLLSDSQIVCFSQYCFPPIFIFLELLEGFYSLHSPVQRCQWQRQTSVTASVIPGSELPHLSLTSRVCKSIKLWDYQSKQT